MGATDVGETLESTAPKNMVQVIYQTRGTVFHMQFQTLRSGLKWAGKTRLRRVLCFFTNFKVFGHQIIFNGEEFSSINCDLIKHPFACLT